MSRQRARRPIPATPPAATPRRKPVSARRVAGIVGTLMIGTAVIAIAFADRTAPAAATTRDPDLIAAGEVLYQASCATCHGADLEGTDTGPTFLDVIYAPNHHADESFQRAVVGGVAPHHWNFGPMVPVAGLSRTDVASIIEFVRSRQEAVGILRDPSHG